MVVPDHIVLKPGKLSPAERTVMQRHAALRAETIRLITVRARGTEFLETAEQIAHGHHEGYDGRGYPRGLKGDAIPLAARIAALADVFDALTSQRPYKEPLPPATATDIIHRASGSQFDPVIVEAFLRREQEFAMVALQLADRRDETLVEPALPRDAVTEPAAAAT